MHFKALANFSPALYFIYILFVDYDTITKGKLVCILIIITALAINLINELRGEKKY
jgi:hypothetical protein